MDVEAVDRAIDRYFRERMGKGPRRAAERFLSYAYMTYTGEEFKNFMDDVAKLAVYYIDYLKVMENPFKGPELPWLASTVAVAVFSLLLLQNTNYRPLAFVILSGAILTAYMLIRAAIKKWREIEVMIAIYKEIIDVVRQETQVPV